MLRREIPQIPTGDPSLDKLLLGGFQREKIITNILLKTCVNTQIILQETKDPKKEVKIAYIDGNNRFTETIRSPSSQSFLIP